MRLRRSRRRPLRGVQLRGGDVCAARFAIAARKLEAMAAAALSITRGNDDNRRRRSLAVRPLACSLARGQRCKQLLSARA